MQPRSQGISSYHPTERVRRDPLSSLAPGSGKMRDPALGTRLYVMYLSISVIYSTWWQSTVDTPRREPFISFMNTNDLLTTLADNHHVLAYLDADTWVVSSNGQCWYFVVGQMLMSLKIASPRRKHSLHCKLAMCLGYNKKSINMFAWEQCLSIKNPEAPMEISIHNLTDEMKITVGGEADITQQLKEISKITKWNLLETLSTTPWVYWSNI